MTGRFINGLAQYGVVRGTVLAQQTLDIVPPNQGPAITIITGGNDSMQAIIDSWLNAQPQPTITPAPAIDEQNLLYVVFLPPESTTTRQSTTTTRLPQMTCSMR